jgi:uncharacterized membrane protein YoaK (UPF0700 family)
MRRMLRLDGRTRRLAAAIAALAGYVDAVGFLLLGGFFVSFMSGNSTRLAVGTAEGAAYATTALGLILIFVAGVAMGALIARRARRPRAVVLACVAVIIAVAALLAGVGHALTAGFGLALAMGLENSAFVAEGGLPVGLTYMTGTLVKLGQELGAVGSARDIVRCVPYALHWLALLAGAIAGALTFRILGSAALWPAVVTAAILSLFSKWSKPESLEPQEQPLRR